jgi:hypothetical protein
MTRGSYVDLLEIVVEDEGCNDPAIWRTREAMSS